jgi:hypothetical protein
MSDKLPGVTGGQVSMSGSEAARRAFKELAGECKVALVGFRKPQSGRIKTMKATVVGPPAALEALRTLGANGVLKFELRNRKRSNNK